MKEKKKVDKSEKLSCLKIDNGRMETRIEEEETKQKNKINENR